MTSKRLESLSSGRIVLLAVLAMTAILIAPSVISGSFGQVGPDNDDIMRLVQLRDLWAGQGWFDTNQSRLGDTGTLMHWSRLVDGPISLIYLVLLPFFGNGLAEKLALGLWPVISALILLAGLMVPARKMGGTQFQIVVGFLVIATYGFHYRFLPGAIDHHNIQIALFGVICGCLALSTRSPHLYAVAGVAIALSLAIGPEVTLFVAVTGIFVALDWALSPSQSRSAVVRFGIAFAVSGVLILVATKNPATYFHATCDAYSGFSALMIGLSGLGLAGVATFLSARSLPLRLFALLALGISAILVSVILAPQCLQSPLSGLSENVQQFWLSEVQEARSFLKLFTDSPQTAPAVLGTQFIGLGLVLVQLYRNVERRFHLLFLILIATSLLLTIHQVRFAVFGHLFSLLPLGFFIASWWKEAKLEPQMVRSPIPVYLLAVLFVAPAVWNIGGLFVPEKDDRARRMSDAACMSRETFEALEKLKPGLVLAYEDVTPPLLVRTGHRALTGNYHRNLEGISAAIDIFASSPERAKALMNARRISYLVFCKGVSGSEVYREKAPEGLIAQLEDGYRPDWLHPLYQGEEKLTAIFEVRK